ncbi:MAG: hypothetical protein ACR2K6_08015 [Solirubrobacterales bacterium]
MNNSLTLGAALLAIGMGGCNGDTTDRSTEPPLAPAGASGASGGIEVSPELPTDADIVSVRAPTEFGEGQRGSNYHFTLQGPTGKSCDESFVVPIGMLAQGAGATIARDWFPTRHEGNPLVKEADATWCPGRYDGAVEFRDPGKNINQKRELPNGIRVYGDLVGTFWFEIRGR